MNVISFLNKYKYIIILHNIIKYITNINKIIIKAEIPTPIIAPIENSLMICDLIDFLNTYVLVVLLKSCMIPCNAMTM